MHVCANSLESTSVKTMQLVSGMVEKAHITFPDIPSVSKAHDDLYLRCAVKKQYTRPTPQYCSHILLYVRSPANQSIGERECVCGSRCLCMFIARVRYGSDNTNGFICKEYLLPDQHVDFLAGKGCPPQRQKCLLCARYFLVNCQCTCLSRIAPPPLPLLCHLLI